MGSFVKLDSGIIHSTIWREPDHIRIVWITMLVMTDQHGDVEASIPGLADASRVTVEQCEEALTKLMSPDPYSRTPDEDGRRIDVIDGGWHVINHAKYRESATEKRRRSAAERQKRKRKKDASASRGSVTVRDSVTHDSVSVSVSVSEKEEVDPRLAAIRDHWMDALPHLQQASERQHARNRWDDALDKLHRLDKHSWGDIAKLVDWIISDKSDAPRQRGLFPGWFYTCQTPVKLRQRDRQGRKYFGVIWSQMERGGGVNSRRGGDGWDNRGACSDPKVWDEQEDID